MRRMVFGAIVGALLALPATSWGASDSANQINDNRPDTNPGAASATLSASDRYVREGQTTRLTVVAGGAQRAINAPGVVSFCRFWAANLTTTGSGVLPAGSSERWTCTSDPLFDHDGDGLIPITVYFQGTDVASGEAYRVPSQQIVLTVAKPSLASEGRVTHSEYVDDGVSRVDVTWTVHNTGNIPVSATIAGESRRIDVGASADVQESYEAPAGQLFSQRLEISGTDEIGTPVSTAAVAEGPAAAPAETPAPTPETTTTRPPQPIPPNSTPETLPESDPDLLGIVGDGNGGNGGNGGDGANPGTTGGSGGPGAPTTSATQPGPNTTQGAATPTTTASTTTAPATTGPTTGGDAIDDVAASPTTAPPDDSVGADPGAEVTPTTGAPAADDAVEADGDDETAVNVGVPAGGGSSLSWSTRVATIAGGALFGLALAGFGWVYVSATQGIERRIRRGRKH
jgi:hypothetical protein